jgi:ABC-type multidrug transport system fused ATPase/permease subunit
MCIDFIVFIKQNGCNLKKFYIVDDPYGFRLEHLIGISFLTLYAIPLSFVPLILYFFNASWMVPEINSLRGEITGVIFAFMITLTEWIALFALCFVVVFLAMLSFCKRRKSKKSQIFESEFDVFINTSQGIEIMKTYAQKDWSLENVLFFEDVLNYQKIKSTKYARKRAFQILENYIELGSPLKVNLSSNVRKSTKDKVENFVDFKDFHKSIFNDAIKETKLNMEVTFKRIKDTTEYQDWKENSNILK